MAAAVLIAGCSADQRRALGEEDARDALTTHVERAVEADGLELDGDLDCRAEIGEDSAMSASCSGAATSGVSVAGTFDGSADFDAESCSAHLVVTIDAASVVDRADVDCFDVG